MPFGTAGPYAHRVLPTVLLTAAVLSATTAVPSHVASLLAEPTPDPSWQDDGAVEEEDDGEAPSEDAVPDAPVADGSSESATASIEGTQPAAPLVATDPVTAPPLTIEDINIPEQKGIGLMATSGALAGVGIGVMAWRISRIKRLCTADSVDAMSVSQDDLSRITDEAADCFVSGRGANAGLWFLQALPNAVNWGIAPGAGTVRAKYDAARSVKTGEIQRKPGVFIGTGAGLLGAGAVGRIVVMVIRIRSLNPVNGIAANCIEGGNTDPKDFFGCYADRNALLYGMHQLTSTVVAAGGGLLAYGVVYKRTRKQLENVYGVEKTAKLELSVQPQLSLDYTGVSAALRF